MKMYPINNYIQSLKNQLDKKCLEFQIIDKEIVLLRKIISESEIMLDDFQKVNEEEADVD
jgi:hypothetical protein